MTTDGTTTAAGSQTLSRGIRILELLAGPLASQTIDELAGGLTVHRSVAYRLVRTLEQHGLVDRDSDGRVRLGAGLAALASGVARDLQAEALPELTVAAGELGMTCFLVVLDHDECVTLLSVEPRHAVATVAQRPGTRHPVRLGAPGRVILAQLPRADWPRDIGSALAHQVDAVATTGWAESQNEVVSSLHAVAVPLALRGRAPAAVAAVYVSSGHRSEAIAQRLGKAAATIRTALDG